MGTAGLAAWGFGLARLEGRYGRGLLGFNCFVLYDGDKGEREECGFGERERNMGAADLKLTSMEPVWAVGE